MTSETLALDHPSVLAAVLFGSHARGDADGSSDTDVAVFADAYSAEELRKVRAELEKEGSNSQTVISLYSTGTTEFMAQQGSLFLWHLKLEGRILTDKDGWLAKLLSHLPPYDGSNAARDLETFAGVLGDCRNAMWTQADTLDFEMATVFSVLRNVGIIYCFRTGTPCFGRTAPINRLASGLGCSFPFFPDQIAAMERMRLRYVRDPASESANISSTVARGWIDTAISLLEFVRGRLND
jgi:hypothetical protein